jgi:hypothetical protein
MKPYYANYVKRFGQWHLSRADKCNGLTLCGVPMLGNNYELDIPEKDRAKCPSCWDKFIKEKTCTTT